MRSVQSAWVSPSVWFMALPTLMQIMVQLLPLGFLQGAQSALQMSSYRFSRLWCSFKGSRQKRWVGKPTCSKSMRDAALHPTAQPWWAPPWRWVCPSSHLPPNKREACTGWGVGCGGVVSLCLQFAHLDSYYFLWRLIPVKCFSTGKKTSHCPSLLSFIYNTMDNGRH